MYYDSDDVIWGAFIVFMTALFIGVFIFAAASSSDTSKALEGAKSNAQAICGGHAITEDIQDDKRIIYVCVKDNNIPSKWGYLSY